SAARDRNSVTAISRNEIALERIAGTVSVGADEVSARVLLDLHPIPAVGNSSSARKVGADAIAGHAVVCRSAKNKHNAILQIARDQIAFRCIVKPVSVSANKAVRDAPEVRLIPNYHTELVRNGGGAGRIGT